MKYRTKLFISFTFLAFLSTLLAVTLFYIKSEEILFQQIRSQILSVGLTAADFLNGDYISTITTKDSTETPEYKALINTLRLIRNTNRRPDFYVSYVCLFKEISKDKYIYLADAEEDPRKVSLFGDPFELDKNELDFNPLFPYVDSSESVDEWGDWCSGLFPIYNSQKQVVANLEIDLNFSYILQKMHVLHIYAAIGFCISTFIGFLISHFLSKKLTTNLHAICKCVEEISSGNLTTRVFLNSRDEISTLAEEINTMAKQLQEKERIKTSFGKYVSQHVLDKILKADYSAQLEGERRKITVLFSDIRSFTSLSESLPPEDIVNFLNDYFEKMIEIIFSHYGTLDKFIGDGIMAEFGAPLDDSHQELNAILAALDMQKIVASLSTKWKGKKYEHIQIGIGIHTGPAIVGNIGSSQRMEYTAVGDTVNVASRLETATKELHKGILISKETYEVVKQHPLLSFEPIGFIQLKGRIEPIEAYSVSEKPSSADITST
jgi:adenylate cyclase